MCTQDWEFLDYKSARLKTSRLWPGVQVSVHGCVSTHWGGRRAAGRPWLSRVTSTPVSLLRGISFGEQEKLKRVSSCAKYLYAEKLAAGWLRKVKGNTNCITIATVSLILSLPLYFLTLGPQHSNSYCPPYKQPWASLWNNNHIFLSFIFY